MAASRVSEPVAFAELVRAVLVVLVALGWITIGDDTVNVIVSAVGLVLSWVLTYLARSRVTPVVPSPPLDDQL